MALPGVLGGLPRGSIEQRGVSAACVIAPAATAHLGDGRRKSPTRGLSETRRAPSEKPPTKGRRTNLPFILREPFWVNDAPTSARDGCLGAD